MTTPEHERLASDRSGQQRWRRFGACLSERQWGTVREDYSADGDAWSSFSHEMARSRVYRWGEDGLAGFSDDRQRLCLGLALWNTRDPILEERLFGLGDHPRFRQDPHFRDHLLLFHEYFHGDTGRGVGASHQTGWTGLVATLLAESSPWPAPGKGGQ